MITTNLVFAEWANVLGDVKLNTALLDRLTHRRHIVETGNESYRLRHSSQTANAQAKAQAQEESAEHLTSATVQTRRWLPPQPPSLVNFQCAERVDFG